ncbi:MAG: DUF2029 domain-containing protein [Acidobacteriota bacterium]|nr:DUF2029 domain-containing protein [Acidobacteriota bacterium]
MKLKSRSLDNIILAAGVTFLIGILFLQKPSAPWVGYTDAIRSASTTLKGRIPFSDFVAEMIGFRGLYNRTNPYPILGPVIKDLGIDWKVLDPPSHPPTSFLFAAPVAFLSWPAASAVWAWEMLFLIALSYRFYGLSWKKALGLAPLTLLWPPACVSLGQVTVIWLFGLAMAYYFGKARTNFWSGFSIGIASATKYWAGMALIIFVLKRRWAAVLGCLALWLLLLSIVLALNPETLHKYFEAAREASVRVISRTDNQAPIIASYRYGGWIGVTLIALYFSLIVFANRRFFYEWEISPSTRVWMLMSYFSVALLPTSYLYSLLPLVPVIIFLLSERKIVTTLIVLYCLLIPSVYVKGGDESVIPVASATLLLGLAFILDLLPLKVFQRKWGEGLLTVD